MTGPEIRAEIRRLRAIRRSWIRGSAVVSPDVRNLWMECVRPVKWWIRDLSRKLRRMERRDHG